MPTRRHRARVLFEPCEARVFLSANHSIEFSRRHFSHRPALRAFWNRAHSPSSAQLSSLAVAVSPAATFSPPVIKLNAATASSVQLSATLVPTGPDISLQWHRGTTAGFTPGTATAIAGANQSTFTDTQLQAGLPYFYTLAATDGTTTLFSPQVIAGLELPTPPIDLPYSAGPIVLAYIGSSTWDRNEGAGRIPDLIRQNLQSAYPSASITTLNGAASGTSTSNFLPGASLSQSLKTALQTAAGFKVLRLMIGSNDAAAGQPLSNWLANMNTIINDALAWPVDRIVLEEIGVRTDGGAGVLERIRQYNAGRSTLLRDKVVLGTAYTYVNQANHIDELNADHVHQNSAGAARLAAHQAAEVKALVADMMPPVVSAWSADFTGTVITATLSEPAGAGPPLTATGIGGFSLEGTSATVLSWSITGTTLTLKLHGRVLRGESVSLTAPAGIFQDAAGNLTDPFTASVTNRALLGAYSIRSDA